MIKKTQTSHNLSFFFFNDTATTEIYTLSLHDALPICLVQLAHELADELHLAALAFEIGDALGLGQGIGQLVGQLQALEQVGAQRQQILAEVLQGVGLALEIRLAGVGGAFEFRSEERRVGKECRSRWSPY